MRTLAGLTAAAMACMTLWSCDQQPAAPAAAPVAPQAQAYLPPPPPVAAAPAPVCNCAAPVRATSVVHRRRHAARYAQDYSQQSAEADYDYVSPSRSYAPPPPRGVGWIDGYGRPHFATLGEIAHYTRIAQRDAAYEPQRLKAWHRYGAHCDWR